MNPTSTPRSVLHALPPIGLGTSEVESLTSYFCRLANSHSCSTNDLAQFVIDHIEPGRWATYQGVEGKSRFVWHQRAISGLGDSALTWASALSELTSQSCLHRLTLLPLQSVVAPKGLMATQSRWCPHCLHDDLEQNKTPYFRLVWDMSLNKVCTRHQTELTACCPHCRQSNVRHASSYVIPGWCTACNCFLGQPEKVGPIQHKSSRQLELEQATQIGSLVATTSSNAFFCDLELLHDTIDTLIGELDAGVAAHFSKRLGVRKATVHYWKNTRTALTLESIVRCAVHCNLDVLSLLQGNLTHWSPPSEVKQLALKLFYPSAVAQHDHKTYDWSAIRGYLGLELQSNNPKSVAQIARSLGIDERLLYIQVPVETRQLGERYLRFRNTQRNEKQQVLHRKLHAVCTQIQQQGNSISMERITQLVDTTTLNRVENLYSVLSDIAANDEHI